MLGTLNRREWLRTATLATLGFATASRGRLFGADGAALPTAASAAAPLRATTPSAAPGAWLTNLAGNENPFGPSPAVVRAIFRAAPESSRYPFREEQFLREALARKEGVGVENIVLGNGCDELLALAGARWLTPGVNLVAATPTYFQLTDYAEKLGAEIRWVAHDAATMRHDLRAMAAAVNDRTRLVYVCNPNNPTGTSRPAAEVEAFCREVAPRAPVFVDEVYLELVDDFAARTQVPLVRAGLPVMIGRSFSKLHGLAGHRIGYVVTTPALAEALAKLQMSSVNFIGVAAARAALEDAAFVEWSRKKIGEGRARLYALLEELKLRYTPSEGNFVFFRTGVPMRAYQARMEARGFYVGWPHAPVEPYDLWCRVSVGTEEEMRQFAAALRAEHSGRA